MMTACVEMILCLLFPVKVTVVRISMNHEEEKRVTGNKIEQANVQKYFTYHVKYGWLFEKRTMRFEMICARKFEIFGPGLCLKRRHRMCLFILWQQWTAQRNHGWYGWRRSGGLLIDGLLNLNIFVFHRGYF